MGGALADHDFKTLNSRRRLYLSAALAAVLRAQRADQDEARIEAGLG